MLGVGPSCQRGCSTSIHPNCKAAITDIVELVKKLLFAAVIGGVIPLILYWGWFRPNILMSTGNQSSFAIIDAIGLSVLGLGCTALCTYLACKTHCTDDKKIMTTSKKD